MRELFFFFWKKGDDFVVFEKTKNKIKEIASMRFSREMEL
jgi:hypothetical protein